MTWLTKWLTSNSKLKNLLVEFVNRFGLYKVASLVLRSIGVFVSESSNRTISVLGSNPIQEKVWRFQLEAARRAIQETKSRIEIKHFPDGAVPELTVIVSLYKSEKYLAKFLRNLEEQTAFLNSEVYIVAVKPSERETTLLSSFVHSNVTVQYVDTKIPIYEAWNLAIQRSSAPLITNANVDDLRSAQSFATQIYFAKLFPNVDIFYQDVLLNLEQSASWHEILAVNARTNLNAVSMSSLLKGINGPHNAPAWRREIHSELGYFDEKYKSAGDAEFWLRCANSNKVFYKIPVLHVSYYLNPEGLSTKVDSFGPLEHREILRSYKSVNANALRVQKLDSNEDFDHFTRRKISEFTEARLRNVNEK